MIYDKTNLQKAIEGNREAFSLIYESIYPDLYKMAVYMSGDNDCAEDIVSETVLDAYKGIGKLKEIDSFDNWIIKILSAKSKRHFKKAYNSFSVKNPKAVNIDDVDTYTRDNVDLHIDILNAMSKLKSLDRTIITLGVVEGYSSIEIGEMFNMNPNTVRSRMNRSLAKMKKELEDFRNE